MGPAESINSGIHIDPMKQVKSCKAAGLTIVLSKATELACQSKSSALPGVQFTTTSTLELSFSSNTLLEFQLSKVSCTHFHTGHSFLGWPTSIQW